MEHLGRHSLIFSPNLLDTNLVSGQADPALAQAQIVFGQPDPRALLDSPNIEWVHLTSAGYERYDNAPFRKAMLDRGTIVTNSSSVYCEPCAQHALAMMLAFARQLPAALLNQSSSRQWPAATLRADSRLLRQQTVVILGYGHIARRLVELLAPFNLRMIVVRRNVAGDETISALPETRLAEVLPLADHVMNLLPGGEATRHYMDASRFGDMKPSAYFYNIGRGSTVDQAALLEALRAGRIAAAYLDVMDPEPLPPDHPLWSTPNCFITPHTAGGHDDEHLNLVRHFLDRLEEYESGLPLLDRIM